MSDPELAGFLRTKEIRAPNRLGILFRNLCLITSLTVVFLAILFAQSLERVLGEIARKIGERDSCSTELPRGIYRTLPSLICKIVLYLGNGRYRIG